MIYRIFLATEDIEVIASGYEVYDGDLCLHGKLGDGVARFAQGQWRYFTVHEESPAKACGLVNSPAREYVDRV